MKSPASKARRNDPCPCGSGKKYKKCCLGRPATVPDEALLDTLFHQAIECSRADSLPASCRAFAAGWNLLKSATTPQMTTFEEVRQIVSDQIYPDDLAFEYIMALENCARDEPGRAETGVEFCDYLLAQFTGENDLFAENIRAYLGNFCFLAGEPERGEKVLRELINDRPHRTAGYANLADCLSATDYRWQPDKCLDKPMAIEVLRQALAHPVEDGADYDLPQRLRDLTE